MSKVHPHQIATDASNAYSSAWKPLNLDIDTEIDPEFWVAENILKSQEGANLQYGQSENAEKHRG